LPPCLAGVDFGVAFDELPQALADRRREGLKNWSMSTGVVVEERPSSAPSSSAGLLFGRG